MKIDNRNDLGAVSTPGAKGAAGVESGGRKGVDNQADGSGADRAELSGLAGKIAGALSKDSADRAAKVEQLRAQVAQGSYRPDAEAISKGIVTDALANAATAGGSGQK